MRNMKIYLAARYSRRLELCGYREQLRQLGHAVDAAWLNGNHQISGEGVPIGEHGEALVEEVTYIDENMANDAVSNRAAKLRQKFAQDDFRDVISCDLLIAFTEHPCQGGRNRGGRHVELGIALGRMKGVYVVGPRENLFCWLDDVIQFDTWAECLQHIKGHSS